MAIRRLTASFMLAAALVAAPAAVTPAAAQTSPVIGTAVPVVLWAVTGAVLGAVAWPMIVGGGAAAAAAPGVMSAGAFLNPGAAAGTVLGGVGYLMTR
jgi:mannose/fructose/N-acetylgalactosamine-specific phosphotransferase system component IIC